MRRFPAVLAGLLLVRALLGCDGAEPEPAASAPFAWAPVAPPADAPLALALTATSDGTVYGIFAASGQLTLSAALYRRDGDGWTRAIEPPVDGGVQLAVGGLGGEVLASVYSTSLSTQTYRVGASGLGSPVGYFPPVSIGDVTGLASDGGDVFLALTGIGELLRSERGGAGDTWTRSPEVAGGVPSGPVTFVDARTVLMSVASERANALARWRLVRSEDAGATWSEVLPETVGFYNVRTGPGGRLVAFSTEAAHASDDGGRTWAPVALPEPGRVIAAAAVTPAGYVVALVPLPSQAPTTDANLFATADGGRMWAEARDGLPWPGGMARLNPWHPFEGHHRIVRAADGHVALMAGGTIYRTTTPVL
ncbi:WD40/YVTN/BNR-like repeat-containing protein [Rubrivirga sp. IMCC43871]|uniref:WD40/YVTN/BNR-like repeat-containing protein n=1 Tax=Rubrivirga sp. IMCC43871 TaxID=3391575 RepID=UPI00398FA2F4